MVANAGMCDARLEALLRRTFAHLEGEDGCWKAALDGLDVYVISDEHRDRIRIMIPVAQADRADNDLLWVLLLANFEVAGEARYAVRGGVVWCVYMHRLSWMSEPELEDALQTVINLARNTGGSFGSDPVAAPQAEERQ